MTKPGPLGAVLYAMALGLAGCGAEPAAAPAADFELSGVGFATPESALHDPVADLYLVSNISGDPFGKDGDGFVSRIAPDGRVLDLKWIAGGQRGVELDAPKGMALTAAHLWIADIDQVRRFDRSSGAPAGAVAIPGATFVNDLAVGPDGAVYASDSGLKAGFEASGTDAIWRIDAELRAEPLFRGEALGQPNGLAFGDRDLFFVSWRTGVFALCSSAGPLAELKLPAAQLDGLVRTGEGRWLASSWAGRCIYRIAPTGAVETLWSDLEAPADLGFDARRGRLLIPLFTGDRLLVRKI
jgi:hypothetical protein